MHADTLSIRQKIFTLALVLLGVAALALAYFIHDYAGRASNRAFDRLLTASALTIAGAVQVEGDAVTIELPVAAFAIFSGSDRIFYAVRGSGGEHVTGYDDLAPQTVPATSAEPRFETIDYGGERVRLVTVGRLVSAANAANWVTIHVAETLQERRALAAEIFSRAMLPLMALTLIAVAIVWFALGRMFAPLATLEHELRARTPDDLSPLGVAVPAEVSQLVGALNDFMARLRQVMDRMSGLVAEAAHEVRTPLASLRAQAELAAEETDPERLRDRVGRIHQRAVQASQLVSQLLMDATVSHRLDVGDARPIPIRAVLDEVIQRLDPARARRVGLTVDPGVSGAELFGDRVVLREMLRNVIDNALDYSDGAVELAAEPRGEDIRFAIADRGPGIADTEKEAVFERFRRGPAAEGRVGSGLGLAIVRRAAQSYGGTVSLHDRDGGGLVVEIVLPARVGRSEEADPGRAPSAAAFCVAALVASALALSGEAGAKEVVFPAPSGQEAAVLTIVGSTDTPLFTPLIRGFQASRPDVTVIYAERDTLDIYTGHLDGSLRPVADLIISSAADLQVKLANDGHARPHNSTEVASLPNWARWRGEVIGFTFEPAVIIYNPDLIAEHEVPRTHLALAELMERNPERFRGMLGTYDISKSGVGYLLAAQDQLISSNFWRLATAFGRTGIHLSGSSPDILDRVERGDLALGYNVLGSYAFARAASGRKLGVVVPDDYVLVITRTALIPARVANPVLAGAFVDFLIGPQGQAILAGNIALGAVQPGSRGAFTAEAIAARGRGAVQPIPLTPALLVSLDQQRRERFLKTWLEIVSPREAATGQ